MKRLLVLSGRVRHEAKLYKDVLMDDGRNQYDNQHFLYISNTAPLNLQFLKTEMPSLACHVSAPWPSQ